MPSLIFCDPRGREHRVEASVGETVLQLALDHRIPGILAECGGCASCGTCSVIVAPDAQALFLPRSAVEQDLLLALGFTQADARLCCQLSVPESTAPISLKVVSDY